MADIISTGISGLNAVQKMMNVVGHNIANVDTPGYTRERANLVARYTGNPLDVGDGVEVQSVSRLQNQFLESQIQQSLSRLSEAQSYHEIFRSISNIINNDNSSIGTSISDLSKTLESIMGNPSDPNTRSAFFDSAKILVDRFHQAQEGLNRLGDSLQAQISSHVEEVNHLIHKIADLNKEITQIERSHIGSSNNDLKDLREQALKELNTYLPVNFVDNGHGNIALYTGNGQLLIQDSRAFDIRVEKSNSNHSVTSSLYVHYDISDSRLDDSIQSGKLGAALHAQRFIIQSIKNQLGIAAAAIADQFNHMQSEGLTSREQWGQDIFHVGNPLVNTPPEQNDHVQLHATFENVQNLKATNYNIHFDGNKWHILRESDQHEDVLDTLPDSLDGMKLTLNGTPQAGDTFTISPGENALNEFSMVMSSPDDIATALPIRTQVKPGNQGTLEVSNYDTDDQFPRPLSASPDIFDRIHIHFTDGQHYNLVKDDGTVISGNQEYHEGESIRMHGWKVTLRGTPKTGDEIIVEKNTNAVGDTQNLNKVAGFASKGYFDNGNKNLSNFYSEITEHIGTQAREASISMDAQNKLLSGLNQERASISGVNLNEEAGNLLRLQELYSANAKVIQMGSRIIDSLISLFR